MTVGTTTLTSSSANVNITGSRPSVAHFGLAPVFRNIAGLVTQGLICPITAIVRDRFGNPVPQNMAVSFFTNGGIVTPQGLTGALGNTVGVEIETAPPTPHVGTPTNFSDPRTGMVTVIAVTQGEETFIDANGNGIFDGPGEFDATDPDLDTPEPFIDHVNQCNPPSCPFDLVPPPLVSGDGQFDPNNLFELLIDGNGNGVWDGPNGVWDANKPIFASTRVLFTGPTQIEVGVPQGNGCDYDVSDFVVPNSGSQEFCLLVSDPAGRPLVGGTQIKVSGSGAGTFSGSIDIVLPDIQRGGPGITFFTFTITDDDLDNNPSEAQVTVEVISPTDEFESCRGKNGDVTVSIPITVH